MKSIFTALIRKVEQGNIFSLSVHPRGEGLSLSWSWQGGRGGGYSTPPPSQDQDGAAITPPPWPGPGRGTSPLPTGQHMTQTGYTAGGMPLAVTQEDFLVLWLNLTGSWGSETIKLVLPQKVPFPYKEFTYIQKASLSSGVIKVCTVNWLLQWSHHSLLRICHSLLFIHNSIPYSESHWMLVAYGLQVRPLQC